MLWNKKRTGLFLLVLISIGLVGCSPEATIQEREPESEAKWVDAKEGFEALEGVWIETEYETYEIGTKSLRVKWFNTLGDPMMYGAGFEIQKKVGNVWKQVSKVKAIEYAFNTIGYILNPSDARWQSYNLICYTDGLTTGEYRVSTTFSRQNLEGVDYGPGNYPNYQVYGTFSVKDLSVKRKLSILDHTKFEYLNELYGFSIMLPKAWEGFQLLIEQETGDDTFDTLSKKIDASYVVVKIRHPKWSIEEPYQDIAMVLYRANEWNNNVTAAIDGNFDLLPTMLPSSSSHVFTKDPTAYNSQLKGYEEVIEILGDGFLSAIQAY